MALRLPNIKTGNTAFPVYQPTADELALVTDPAFVAWLEFDDGLVRGGNAYDRRTVTGYAITGSLSGGGTTPTSRGAAVFTGTQSIDLGNIFPVNSSYSIFAAYSQGASGAIGLVGSSNSSYRSFHVDASTGALRVSHNGTAVFTGTTTHTKGVWGQAAAIYTEPSKGIEVYYNGVADSGTITTPAAHMTDASCTIGNIPGLAGDRKFRGSMGAVLIFSTAKTGSDRAFIEDYLRTTYGLP